MTTLLQDLRFGLRMMGKAPIVSGVAVLSLALGIAANASMFALLNAFLFEPLPYADQDHLVMFRTLRSGEQLELSGGVAIPNLLDYASAAPSVEDVLAYVPETANVTGLDVPEQVNVIAAFPSLFDVIGVQPALGRGFRSEEGVEGAGRVLVLHHDFWQRRFFGDPSVLGRTVTLDGDTYTVIGIMPEGFDMVPANVQAFRPTDFTDRMEDRATRGFVAMARVRDGAGAEQVAREVEGVHARLRGEFPEEIGPFDLLVQPAREFFPGPTDTQLIRILTIVTLFGLMIACANIANLLLGRAEERQQEVAVRTALGAGRDRILRQLLTESVLLGAVAGVIGVALSIWVVGWLQSVMPPQIPDALMPSLRPEVVLATLGLAVLTGIVFGMAPALQSVRGDLRESLGAGARGGTASRSRKRLRNAFVVGEVAVALGLLAGAGTLVQAFGHLVSGDTPYDPEALLTFQIVPLEDRYESEASVIAYARELLDAVGTLPGVDGAAAMSALPRSQASSRTRYTIEGRPAPERPDDRPTAGLQLVSLDYFDLLGLGLREGRTFGEEDREGAELVVVVSDALARRDFPGEDAIGRRIEVRGEPRTIVGVVDDLVQDRIALAGRAGEQVYLPMGQVPNRSMAFALRTTVGDPAALSADVRQAVWAVQPEQPISSLRTLQDSIEESLAGPRAIMQFLLVLGGITLALAAMGIYGVMAHSVSQQQREIGIRMALGARRGRVVRGVAGSGLLLVAVGLVLGLPLAALLIRQTQAALNLFEADIGIGTPVGLAAGLVAVALVATLLPARRASRVAPVAALKE